MIFIFSSTAQKLNREKFKEFVNTLAGIKTDEVNVCFLQSHINNSLDFQWVVTLQFVHQNKLSNIEYFLSALLSSLIFINCQNIKNRRLFLNEDRLYCVKLTLFKLKYMYMYTARHKECWTSTGTCVIQFSVFICISQ